MTAAVGSAVSRGALARIRAVARVLVLSLWRFRLIAVYAVVVAVYLAIVRIVPSAVRPALAAVLLYTDPAILGFLFAGGIVLLERDGGTYAALFSSPVRPLEYLTAVTLVFALLGGGAGLVISAGALAGSGFGPGHAAGTGALLFFASMTFTFLGLGVAARSRTINQFFGRTAPLLALINAPLLAVVGLMEWRVAIWLPGGATLAAIARLTGAREAPPSTESTALGILSFVLWMTVATVWGRLRFQRRVVMRLGDS